jgi:hypothetical protein|tara:strand:+ start:1560 stop:1772 length:213 start_codon:yes stop_codon:yes gene_type:complete
MATYVTGNTNVKVIVGTVTATHDKTLAGSLAKAVHDYIITLDATDSKIISVESKPAGYGNTVIVTIVSGA